MSRLNRLPSDVDGYEFPKKNLINYEQPQPVTCVIIPDDKIMTEQNKDPDIVID